MNLTTYLRAGYPGLAIISSEEARAEAGERRLDSADLDEVDANADES